MKRTLRLLLVAVIVLSMVTLSVSAKGKPDHVEGGKADIQYLALGDSIGAGVGASDYNPFSLEFQGSPPNNKGTEGYVEMFYNHLDRQYGEVDLHNWTVSGMRSSELLQQLAVIPMFGITDEPVDDVEVITLSIGGADMLTPLVEGYKAVVSTPAALTTVVGQLQQDAAVSVTSTSAILIELNRITGGDAVVYVTNLYNPMWYVDLPGSDDFAPYVDLLLEGDGLADPGNPYGIMGYNYLLEAAIAEMNANPLIGLDIRLVDVYGDFMDYGNPHKPPVHRIDDMMTMGYINQFLEFF